MKILILYLHCCWW